MDVELEVCQCHGYIFNKEGVSVGECFEFTIFDKKINLCQKSCLIFLSN